MSVVAKFINKCIKSFAHRAYILDSRIPTAYLIGLLFELIFSFLRKFKFYKLFFGASLVGRGVVIKCQSRLFNKGTLRLGDGVYIDALSVNGIRIDGSCSIGRNVRIECTGDLRNIGLGLILGENVGIGSDCFLGCAGGVEIGSDTIFGNAVSIHSENHTVDRLDIPFRLQGVTRRGIKIGSNCWIGARTVILDGAEIADSVVIGANSVVTSGIYESGYVYGGVPAKKIRMI